MVKANRIIAILILLITGYLYSITLYWKEHVAKLPQLVLQFIGILAVILIITGGGAIARKTKDIKEIMGDISFQRLFISIAACIMYMILINFLGFYSATFIFLTGMFSYIKIERKIVIFVVPGCVLVCLYGIFTLWLGVPVPQGLLF